MKEAISVMSKYLIEMTFIQWLDYLKRVNDVRVHDNYYSPRMPTRQR